MTKNSAENCVPLTHIQKLIADRMLKSKQTKPCYYMETSADMTDLLNLRPALRKALGFKITTNAFYIRCLGIAAAKFPIMVGTIEGNSIKIADSVNVGFAVNAPQGLVVPVVKSAEKKTLLDIAREEKLLTEKARSNRLTIDEVQGETIGLSNLGAYNIDSFIGIVPPPASTIVAVGNVIAQIVVKDGQITERKLLSLTLAADSRIIPEQTAAESLNLIKTLLENPEYLI